MSSYHIYIEKIRDKYIRYFSPKSNLVEVGCGDCVFFRILADKGFNIIGIDTNLQVVKNAAKRGLNVLHGEATNYLKRRPNQFDGIICIHVLEHIPNGQIDRLISACQIALKSGGRLLIITPNVKYLGGMENFWDDSTHIRPYSVKGIEKILLNKDFRIIQKGFDKDTKIAVKNATSLRLLSLARTLLSLFIYGRAGRYTEVFIIAAKN